MASNWNPIIEKFHKRLISWKAKTLLYGGRLTLLKSVLGALVVVTFFTEYNSLWKLIFTSIHGPDGGVSGFNSLGSSSSSMPLPLSPWNKIMNLNKHLVCADINLQSIFSRKGEVGIREENYVMGMKKNQLDGLLYLLCDFDPSDVEDSWACSLNSNNTYTVSSMRKMIEGNLLPFQEEKIHWNRYLQIKVNILSWCLRLNRLPTYCNLDHRGIALHTTRCPLCNEDLETSQHIFVDCLIADPWNRISRW
ncbi:reverse transcriptase domain, reverse transcriptase zinc-binding domain protein [Tanacetum coccineum]